MLVSELTTWSLYLLLLLLLLLLLFHPLPLPSSSFFSSPIPQTQGRRGLALGIYNWGIYIGFSMAFLFEFIVEALEWRWAFRIAALFSFLVALVLMVSVVEPRRKAASVSSGGGVREVSLIQR